jgi:PAS domain S-box-containing protein
MWVTKLDRKRSFVNRAYVDFLGITYDQAVDFDWRDIIHPDDAQRTRAESIAGEASLEMFVLESRFRRADGEWRWLRSISQPRWGTRGEHVGFIGVAHDITEWKLADQALREMNETLERRVSERTADLVQALERLKEEAAERERAEQALRQAQKMEAVGRLTGGIAHDFNNLLTPVIGGLELIAAGVEDPRLKRLAQAALDSGLRGAKLATQLLAFSRVQRIQIAPVPVDTIIENLRQILNHTIGSAISIQTRLDAPGCHALCDENQLENAILNLAINARDAMPDGGLLTIATARESQGGAPDLAEGDYVRITVSDTGLGMPAEVLARATEPFFSTKPFGKGTGLGLAQVYGIARQSGGTIRIESLEGNGTHVHILLPDADPPPAQAIASAPVTLVREIQGECVSILVVDDDEEVRTFLAETLESLGHSVAACAGGEAALELLSNAVPDLLLIDFTMPGMNGAELARIVRARHPGVPLAFVTGYAESDQMESALVEDVPVLRKPFGVGDLAALVASLASART